MRQHENKGRDNYGGLAESIHDIARNMEARQHAPTAIGNWDIGNGYGEGIYVHRGLVWHETGPSGTWAAYSGGATYERRPMAPNETASLLRRMATPDLEDLMLSVRRIQHRLTQG